jgi:hypothetical protein
MSERYAKGHENLPLPPLFQRKKKNTIFNKGSKGGILRRGSFSKRGNKYSPFSRGGREGIYR